MSLTKSFKLVSPYVLAKASVAATLTGTTAETVLATIPIEAGLLGLNGRLLIRAIWSLTSSANNKTLRCRIGGIVGSDALGAIATTIATARSETEIIARNSQSSQIVSSVANRSIDQMQNLSLQAVRSVNMAIAQDIVLTGQLALGTETLALEAFSVLLFPG